MPVIPQYAHAERYEHPAKNKTGDTSKGIGVVLHYIPIGHPAEGKEKTAPEVGIVEVGFAHCGHES